jgi:hypothetical protein
MTNYKLEGMWEEVVMADLKLISRHFSGMPMHPAFWQ